MWNDLKSGPVDYGKRDAYFLLGSLIWTAICGVAMWALGLLP